jgi:hypothetical protein
VEDAAHLLAQVHAELGLVYAQSGESECATSHMAQALLHWRQLFEERSDMSPERFPDPSRTRLVLRTHSAFLFLFSF